MRTHGWKHVWRNLSWHTPNWLFYYDHSINGLAIKTEVAMPEEEGLSFRMATTVDAEAMQALGMGTKEFLRRLKTGDQCSIALRKDEVRSMCWAGIGKLWIKASGSVLDCGEDSLYVYNGYTLSSERGKGLLKGCYRVLFDYYYPQGRTKVYNAISIFNLVSRIVNKKTGLEIVGETVLFRILGLSICYYKRWPHPTRRLRIFVRCPDPEARPV